MLIMLGMMCKILLHFKMCFSLQKNRRRSDSSGCSSGVFSDLSLNSPHGLSDSGRPLAGIGNILLSPTNLIKGTGGLAYPAGLSPAKSPIKGLSFSPSQFLNSPGALEGSKLTSTPVLKRVHKQRVVCTPPG